MPRGVEQVRFPQVAQMSGSVYLGDVQYELHMADAEGASLQKIENAKSCGIAQAFVDLDQLFHGHSLYIIRNIRQ